MWGDDNPYQTMSIATTGPSTLPKAEVKRFAVKSTNDISDIDGAQSGPKYKLFTNKPQFSQADIPGSTSKQLCRGRNTKDLSLYIDDIEGTRKMIKDRMMRTNRHVNPLEPQYQLPSYATIENPQPKFVRDAMDVSDIDGTKPKPKKELTTRDIMSINDIDGAKPGLKHSQRLNNITTRNILEVQDISARTHRYIDRTSRHTDPNDPSYVVNGMEIKDDPLSKPKPPPKQLPNFLLMTKDITGAEAGSRHVSNFVRTEVRNIMNIADIEGTQADSIKHSIVSTRRTNPLQPVYQALDPGEMLLPVIMPVVPPDVVKIPTVPARIRAKPQSAGPKGGAAAAFTGGVASTATWGANAHDGGDLEPVLFTSQPGSGREKPPSGRSQALGLALPQSSLAAQPSARANGYSGFPTTTAASASAAPSASAFNYTSYSNTNFNAAPYSSTLAQTSARGSAPSSGRLSKRAQASLEADMAMVRSLA